MKKPGEKKLITPRGSKNSSQLGWSEICPRLYQSTDATRLPQNQLKEVMSWCNGPKGLLLVGPTGVGKTRCAFLLLRKLHQEGLTIATFDCVDFGHECARWFGSNDGDRWIRGLVNKDIVYLDDLGKMRMTERVESELFGLFEKRIARKKPIIATTQFTGNTLERRMSLDIGAAIVRRIKEFCRIITFNL